MLWRRLLRLDPAAILAVVEAAYAIWRALTDHSEER
jgi:hypothetical protein